MKTKKLKWVYLFLLLPVIAAGSNQTTQSSNKKHSYSKESGLSLEHTTPLNNYSFDLYNQVKSEEENILLSPLSTYYALLMAYEGSRGKTREEFEKILYLQGGFHKTVNSLLPALDNKQQDFQISNAIWTDDNLTLKDEFKKVLNHKYSSEIMQSDFNNKKTAVSDINGWIAEKTNDKVRELVKISDIKDSTSLIIVNTVYFTGEWLNKFEKKQTKTGTFFTSAKNQYNVDFMNITEHLPYFETDTYQFISKPYKGSPLSFCIILPKKKISINEIEKELDTDFLKEVLDSVQITKTQLSMPKLKLESRFELSSALKCMGLNTAFSDASDFSGISGVAPLALNEIVHKTVIELDEEKTEAAAATASTFYVRGIPSGKVFKADRPFMFFVMDNQSRAILFIGKYSRPADGKTIDKEEHASNLEKWEKEEYFFGNKPQKILFIIDEKIKTQADFNRVSTEEIDSFSVIKEKEKIKKYSSDDYDAAIIITLKK